MNWMIETSSISYIFKSLFINLGVFYSSIKMLNIKEIKASKIIVIIISSLIITLISTYINRISKLNINSVIYMIILISITFSLIFKYKIGYSMIVNIISIGINQTIFFISLILGYLVYGICKISNEYINLMIILIIYFLLLLALFRIKRIRNGIAVLKDNENNTFLESILINISIAIIFTIIIIDNYNEIVAQNVIIMLIFFSIIMFITIQKSLQLYYKQKMLIQDLNETKKELSEKTKEVESLEGEILKFNKTSHSISHMQKSLEFKLNKLAMNNEIAEENDLRDKIKNLTKDFQNKPIIELTKTGIEEVDDMLEYMQSECIENKIDFELKVNGNIHEMTNNYIDKKDLQILLADHIKDAIIAINHSKGENKNILVRLGKIDGVYGLNIYDSGIEFEISTLMKLGKKPITTHKDEGGTGIGFMNTFDTLDKTKGSLEIHERGEVSDTDFTKALKFKFDGKHEFKIVSYRYDKIKELDTESELIVEKTL